MGFFSSETVTTVNTSAMHLADASQDPVSGAVIDAILSSGVPYVTRKDITGNLLDAVLTGFGNKVPLVHRYAEKYYKLGLPAGATVDYDPINDEDLAPYIIGETGYTTGVLVTDHTYAAYEPVLAIYDFLVNTRGYDHTTGYVDNWPEGVSFTQYWDEDLELLDKQVYVGSIAPNPDNLTVTVSYTLRALRPVVTGSGYNQIIEELWEDDPNTVTEVVAIPGADGSAPLWGADALFASYKQLDGNGSVTGGTKYWYYIFETELYPALEPTVGEAAATFLPVVPIRYNNEDLTDPDTQNTPEDDTNLFSTSKRLLSYLDIDFEAIGGKLNANPDIADIDHAYIMWGVNLQTDHDESIYYLTQFFNDVYNNQTISELEFTAALADPVIRTERTNTLSILNSGFLSSSSFFGSRSASAGSFKEHGLTLDIEHDYVTSTEYVGTIKTGKVGNSTKEIVDYTATISTTRYDIDGNSYVVTDTKTRQKLVLKSQVSRTTVREVHVHNLKIHNYIYGSYKVSTSLSNINKDEDNNNLIIPIQFEVAQQCSVRIRDVLYTDSLLIVINTVQRDKLPWYTATWFKVVLVIVSIVVAYYAGIEWASAIWAAYGAILGTLIIIAAVIVVGELIKALTNWIVTTYGAKIGIIGAVVLMVVALVLSRGTANPSPFLMMTASLMTQTSTALISSANEFLVEEGASILDEYKSFIEKMDGLWDELETIEDLLEFKADVDPLLFTKPNQFMIVPTETPSQFYQRCLGLADNTMFTIHGDIHHFMDARLKLDISVSKEMQQMNLYG